MEKIALITGGSRGIGSAIVNLLQSKGFKLLIPSRKEMDLSDNNSIEEYCKSITGNIDVIINCAGINTIAMLNDLNDQDLFAMIQIDLLAPLKIVKCLNQKMGKNGLGRIVNISSIWSVVSKEGRSGYSAAKAGLNGMTRALSLELAKENILVNSIAPGFVNTELTKQNNSPEELNKIRELIPLNRLAEPEEIANLVYFLSSDLNTYITGQTIIIDGGFVCK